MPEKDAISYLVENGISLEDLQGYLKNGISLEELRAAMENRARRVEIPAGSGKKDSRPTLDRAGLEEFLTAAGIDLRYNVIAKELQIRGMPKEYNPETLTCDLPVILHDELKRAFRCTKEQIADLLAVIAGRRRFNPVLELLAGTEWDRKDRFPELFEIMRLPKSDALSRILLTKWLTQSVAMARNGLEGAYGADGILVLAGPQGIGKTTLVRTLGMRPDLYKLGQWLDARDKDTYRRCTSAWIVELGELETTLRSDLERMKAFVTAERDEYRLPYGRADQVLARRTSLVATCNSGKFLIDPTGSRRFWTVPVEEIDLEGLKKLDILQLWKQAEANLEWDGQGFRLSRMERDALYRRNSEHEKPLKAQPEVEDILSQAEADPVHYEWVDMTVSDFKAEYNALRNYTVEQIGKALDKMGIETKRVRQPEGRKRLRTVPRIARKG